MFVFIRSAASLVIRCSLTYKHFDYLNWYQLICKCDIHSCCMWLFL